MNTQQLTPIGYVGVGDNVLFRSGEGIVSHSEEEFKFKGLQNYPVVAQFSGRAFEAISAEFSRCSQPKVEVYANLKSGRSLSLCIINGNFFRRVINQKEAGSVELSYEVNNFKYRVKDPTSVDINSERYPPCYLREAWRTRTEDVVASFGARFFYSYIEVEDFKSEKFGSTESAEKIELRFEVTEKNKWDLIIRQI